MTSKRVLERQQRNKALGEQHARTVCRFCQRHKVDPFWAPFCSEGCDLDWTERERMAAERLEARR